MYIPDKEWDDLVSEACDILDYLNLPFKPEFMAKEIHRMEHYKSMLQAFINLEDKPVPNKSSLWDRILRKARKVFLG